MEKSKIENSDSENVEESEESQFEILELKEVSDESKYEISGSENFEEFESTEMECLGISKHENTEESEGNKEFKDLQTQIKCEMKLFDTLKCKDFLNKDVAVRTVDGKCHLGLLKCLDPMTGDMIIVHDGRPNKKTLIFQETCVSVTLLNEDKHKPGLRIVLPHSTSERRKYCLLNWFKHHQLPIQENKEGSLLVFKIATINPPYEPDDCFCDNPAVLEQTKTIVQNLPL